ASSSLYQNINGVLHQSLIKQGDRTTEGFNRQHACYQQYSSQKINGEILKRLKRDLCIPM
ncbi:hypothetical protein Pmar_PMAR006351, partial [Perkinsus marinus ATCC 50983]